MGGVREGGSKATDPFRKNCTLLENSVDIICRQARIMARWSLRSKLRQDPVALVHFDRMWLIFDRILWLWLIFGLCNYGPIW